MKSPCLLTSLFLVVSCAMAQAQGAGTGHQILHRRLVQDLVAGQTARQGAAKATSAERLIAESDYSFDNNAYFLTDTIHYNYSPAGLGSWFNYNNVGYNYYYNQGPIMLNAPIANATGAAMNPYVSCDSSLEQVRQFATSTLANNMRSVSTYDAAGDLATQYYYNSNGAKNGFYVVNSYLPSGSYDFTYTFQILNNVMHTDTAQKRYFFYNSGGQLVMDSAVYRPTLAWHPQTKHTYSYDVSGKLITIVTYSQQWNSTSWALSQRDSISYNSNNKVISVSSDTGASLGHFMKSELTYFTNPALSFYKTSMFSYWNSTSLGWDTSQYFSLHLSSANLPDACTYFLYAVGGARFAREYSHLTYDSYNNPLTVMDTTYDAFSNSNWGPSIRHFYYGTYAPLAVAPSRMLPDLSLAVYPNPANEVLNIQFTPAASGDYSIVLYSMDGRIARTITKSLCTAGKQQTITTTLKSQPAGMYRVAVIGAAGICATTSILKQ